MIISGPHYNRCGRKVLPPGGLMTSWELSAISRFMWRWRVVYPHSGRRLLYSSGWCVPQFWFYLLGTELYNRVNRNKIHLLFHCKTIYEEINTYKLVLPVAFAAWKSESQIRWKLIYRDILKVPNYTEVFIYIVWRHPLQNYMPLDLAVEV